MTGISKAVNEIFCVQLPVRWKASVPRATYTAGVPMTATSSTATGHARGEKLELIASAREAILSALELPT